MKKIKVKSQGDFMYHPDLEDVDFYKKIYSKKEFNQHKIPKITKTMEELCSPGEFTLSPPQNFLKNYISIETPYNGILVFHGVGAGKCFKAGTPILMYNGKIKKVEDIKIGDKLIGDDNKIRIVQTTTSGFDKMYEIIPKYGDKFVVNSEHILCIKNKSNEKIDISVKDYLKLKKEKRKELKMYRKAVKYPKSKKFRGDYAYNMGLFIKTKIPNLLLRSSYKNRLDILAGIIDRTNLVFTKEEFNLVNDIKHLARSLGFLVLVELRKDIYYVRIHGEVEKIPLKYINLLELKKRNLLIKKSKKRVLEMRFKVKSIGKDKYYGFSVDGNHRFLLGDFTVTHNSCAAISIAEQFKEHIKKYNKKVLVILKKNIQKGFIKQIFDLDKDEKKHRKDDIVQCTGLTYTLPPEMRHLTRDQKQRKIRTMIRNNYQFVGYEQFANQVLKKTNWDGDKTKLTPIIIKKIENEYSNRVIIIDEVHHVNIKSSTDVKKVPPILETIIKYGKNIRLILMSATPMFDKPLEIIYLLNLLLLNDKREPIKIKDVFDRQNNLTENGKKILKEKSKGYISYVRGEDPVRFPLKIYPKEAETPKLKYDIHGDLIKKDDQMRFLKLILCDMSKYQYTCYKNVLDIVKKRVPAKTTSKNQTEKNKKNKKVKKIIEVNNSQNQLINTSRNGKLKNRNDIIETEMNVNIEVESDKKEKRTPYLNLTFICNIVYPTVSGECSYGSEGIPNQDNGNGGLVRSIIIHNNRKRLVYKYQKHAIFNRGKANETPFLSTKMVKTYSNKFLQCFNNLIKSEGIVFVYSRWLSSGVVPFALMLEQNGILRFEESGDKQLLDYRSNNKGGGGKSTPICYKCGGSVNEAQHKNFKRKDYHKWYPARYILLTGDKMLTKIDIGRAMDAINSNNNTYGQMIKIVIGNEAISEGIDFHNIRQVHILEPWYNVSALEQIIGRAVRTCSHKKLKPEERNVEIFQYASTPAKGSGKKAMETETIDEYNYRKSEIKDVKIKQVERVLKENAVDCFLNKYGNIFVDNRAINIVTSRGQRIKHKMGDKSFSRECDYMKECNYKCSWEPKSGEDIKINEDTYDVIFAKNDIDLAKRYIKQMFKKNIIYDLSVIEKFVKSKVNWVESKFIYKALSDMLRDKEIVYDKFNREGYLIYRGKYYIFQPREITYEKIPVKYRSNPITVKTKSIIIKDHVDKIEKIKVQENNVKKNKVNIYEMMEKMFINTQKSLEKTIKANNINEKTAKKIILGMVLDQLSASVLLSLLKELILKHNKKQIKKSNLVETNILDYYDHIFYYDNRDKSKIQGFKFQGKYYCIKNDVWSLCSTRVIEELKLAEKLQQKKMADKKFNSIYGIVIRKKNKVLFQIIDQSKYKKSLTTQQKVSKRSELTGRTCGTYKMNELVEIQSKLKLKDIDGKMKRANVCMKIEFFLRLRNMTNTDNKIWFQNRTI